MARRPSPILVFIFEEMLLSGLVSLPFERIELIFASMLQLSLPEDEESSFRSAVLSAFMTMIILCQPPLSAFTRVLAYVIPTAFRAVPLRDEYQEDVLLRTGCLMAISRAVMTDKPAFFQFLQAGGLTPPQFFDKWLATIPHLSSKRSVRITLIAVLHALDYAGKDALLAHQD